MSASCFDLSAGGFTRSSVPQEDGGCSSVAHWRGHRRTKSAGSSSSRDFSMYTNMGLYAHHGHQQQHQQSVDAATHQAADNTCHSTYEFVKVVDRIRHDREQGCHDRENLRECGLFSFRPLCLQRFANIQVFVFLCCVLVTLQQALSSGYFNSVVTTIEKRFDIPSRVSGGIASTFEVGNMITIIFVSYLGTHKHIPVWIAKGILVMGVGSCLFALPYLLDQQGSVPKEILSSSSLSNSSTSNKPWTNHACKPPTVRSVPADRASPFINPPESDPSVCNEGHSSNALYILIFMLSQVLIGCGGSPIFTLGTTYIDDHVKKESSSMYIGCMYSMVAFGLVCGFLLGGYLLSYHEDSIFGHTPEGIYPGHPSWIGAWWAGFVIFGFLLMLVALPYFAFPKFLQRERELLASEKENEGKGEHHVVEWQAPDEQAEEEAGRASTSSSQDRRNKYGRDIKDIPTSMWRLLCNPVYIITCLGSCMELSIVSGFVIFLPKYLETQFSIGKSQANIFTGGIAIPGACVGIFMGGYVLKRFQMKPKGAIQFVLFFNIICMCLYTLLYFLGCDNIRMAGTTQPYFNNTSSTNEPETTSFQVNLTADCNMGCQCSPNHIEPVCGRNGITYFSACYAGCRPERTMRTSIFNNCACIPNNGTHQHEVLAFPLATLGPCPNMCDAIIPFMVLLFIMTLVVSITQMPLLMITLRSVEEEERSFALGMQFVIFRLFGYIPSPIIFGNVIDSTCLLWKAHCGRPGGFCLMYDIEDFRLRYIGVCSGLKVASGLLFFLDWIFISLRQKKELEQPSALTLGEIMSSIISLDRLSALGWGDSRDNEEASQPLHTGDQLAEEPVEVPIPPPPSSAIPGHRACHQRHTRRASHPPMPFLQEHNPLE